MFPVDARPHGVRRLQVGQTLDELQDRDEG